MSACALTGTDGAGDRALRIWTFCGSGGDRRSARLRPELLQPSNGYASSAAERRVVCEKLVVSFKLSVISEAGAGT